MSDSERSLRLNLRRNICSLNVHIYYEEKNNLSCLSVFTL